MIYDKILKILNDLNLHFDEIDHESSTSCEHSKELRAKAGLEWVWSKNIVFQAKWNFYLVTTLWDKDIKARKFKHEFWTKDIRFASQDEITLLKLWVIWSISPFWFDNENIPVYIDTEIFKHKYFMFNPWNPCKSIRLKTTDLRNIYKTLKNQIKFFDIWEEEINFINNDKY